MGLCDWYFVLNALCTNTTDSDLANSNTQKAFVHPWAPFFFHLLLSVRCVLLSTVNCYYKKNLIYFSIYFAVLSYKYIYMQTHSSTFVSMFGNFLEAPCVHTHRKCTKSNRKHLFSYYITHNRIKRYKHNKRYNHDVKMSYSHFPYLWQFEQVLCVIIIPCINRNRTIILSKSISNSSSVASYNKNK